MMKKLYMVLALMSAGMTMLAQGNDPDAKKILDAVSAKFKTFKTVKAAFTYKVENAAGKALSTKTGTIMMKGTKYRISFGGQEIFCDGKTVWNYDKSANEVTVNNLDESGGGITPAKLFTDFYNNDFLYKLNGEKKVGGKVLQEIEMTPTDKNKSFHKVYLMVDKVAKTINSTRVLEKTGDRFVYSVTSMNTSTPMADNLFVFDKSKYPGVEVVDLR